MQLTIMRRIKFCAGHRLFGHGGKCEHFHGHNYVADFFVTGDQVDSVGRVLDFADLKARVKGWIDEHWDHWDHSFLVFDKEMCPKVLEGSETRSAVGNRRRVGLVDGAAQKN